MVYEVKCYFSIVFKTPNMSHVNLTRGIPEGPKSEDNTRVKVNPNIRQDTLKSAPSSICGPLSWQLIKSTKLKLMEYMITILQ